VERTLLDDIGKMLATPAFWVATAITVTLGIITTWFFARDRKPVLYLERRVTSLVQRKVQGLTVTFNDMALAAPALVSIELTNVGRSDLASAAFDQERPITVTLPEHVKIQAVLRNVPDDLPARSAGATLELGPHMLKAGSTWVVELLVDSGQSDEDWIGDVETRVTLGAEHLVNARVSRRDPVRVNAVNAFAWFSGMLFATWGLVSGTILAAVNPGAGMALVGFSALGISLASMKLVRLLPGGVERRPPRTLGPKSPADE
jgi:hypothetical protein